MRYTTIIIYFLNSIIFAEICHENTGWCFNQSTAQAFYIFEIAKINDIELISGDLEQDGAISCPNDDCDAVGVFYENVCLGWSFYGINALDNFTLVANGYDGVTPGTENYILNGNIPYFKIYDKSNETIMDATASEEISMFQNFGGFQLGELNAEFESVSKINFLAETLINSVYPNPFNAQVTLNYTLKHSDIVSVTIYDISGNKIQTYSLGFQNSGNHSWIWKASRIPSGEYFIQLKSSILIQYRKLLLIK